MLCDDGKDGATGDDDALRHLRSPVRAEVLAKAMQKQGKEACPTGMRKRREIYWVDGRVAGKGDRYLERQMCTDDQRNPLNMDAFEA